MLIEQSKDTADVLAIIDELAERLPSGNMGTLPADGYHGYMGLLLTVTNLSLKRFDAYGIDMLQARTLIQRLKVNGISENLAFALALRELWPGGG